MWIAHQSQSEYSSAQHPNITNLFPRLLHATFPPPSSLSPSSLKRHHYPPLQLQPATCSSVDLTLRYSLKPRGSIPPLLLQPSATIAPLSMASTTWMLGRFLLLFALIVAVSAEEEAEVSEEFVVSLDHSNFTDFIKNHDFVLVEFYAPWCGACKALTPKYAKAASMLSNHDPPIVLAKVDAVDENNKELKTKYGVRVYPTLKILRKGGEITLDFKGSTAEPETIIEYLKKHRGPASTEIKSKEDATKLMDANKIVVIGVFPEFSGKEFENFVALSENLRIDYEFAHTSDAKHLPRGESSVTGPFVRLFKPFDELFNDIKDFNLAALANFVEESSTPLVTMFDKDPGNSLFLNKFVRSLDSKAMLFANFSEEVTDTIKAKYNEVAMQFKGQGLAFLFGDGDIAEGVFRAFGLNKEQLPLIIIQANSGEKYLKTNLEADQIAPWLKDYKEGKLPIYLKSEPIPETNNDPVKVVVGKTLEDMVLNSAKNVLVAFQVPWEEGSKKLAPILEEIAMEYQSVPDVVVAKFHETANDYPTEIFTSQSVPTLYFKRASGQLVKYEGEMKKEDIVDFVEKSRDRAAEQEAATDKAAKQEGAKDEL